MGSLPLLGLEAGSKASAHPRLIKTSPFGGESCLDRDGFSSLLRPESFSIIVSTVGPTAHTCANSLMASKQLLSRRWASLLIDGDGVFDTCKCITIAEKRLWTINGGQRRSYCLSLRASTIEVIMFAARTVPSRDP